MTKLLRLTYDEKEVELDTDIIKRALMRLFMPDDALQVQEVRVMSEEEITNVLIKYLDNLATHYLATGNMTPAVDELAKALSHNLIKEVK